MARQLLIPGGVYLNETGGRQYLIPGTGYVNETQGAGTTTGVGSSSGSASVAGVGASIFAATGSTSGSSTVNGSASEPGVATGSAAGTSTVSGVGTSSSSNPTNVISRLLAGWGQVNPTGRRQYLIPGRGYFNETAPEGSAGQAEGTSTVTGIGSSVAAGTGESSGSSSASGVSYTGSDAAGTAAGSATVTGVGSYSVPNFASYFSPDELFTHIDLLPRVTVTGTGSSSGSSSVTGVGASLAVATGSAEGSSEATGEGSTGSVTEIAIHGTPKALYSFIRPVGYNPATDPVPLRIERVSDGVQADIGFAAGGLIDIDAANAFAPGGWYEHTVRDMTGNGYHLTVPAGVQKPLYLGNTVGGVPSFTFNGPSTNQALANYSLPIANIRNHTVFAILRANQGGIYEIGLPTRRNTLGGNTDGGLNWTGVQGQSLMSSPQVFLAVGNGTSARVLKQNHITTTAAAQASNSSTGLSLGATINLTTPGSADYVTFAIYDETLTPLNQEAQRDAGYAAVPAIPRAANNVMVGHGDSITQGNSRTQNMSVETLWFNILMKNTATPFSWYNHGHGGWTPQQLLAVTPAVGAATINPSGTLGVILFAGTNALAANRSGADVYDDIKAWAAAWRTAGATHIHVVDTLPRKAIFSGGANATSFETERQALNGLIPTGVGTHFDSCSSPGTHPILGDPANCNGTYFIDQIHPNVLGNQILESVINAGTAAMRS